jgi:hypothetical protein
LMLLVLGLSVLPRNSSLLIFALVDGVACVACAFGPRLEASESLVRVKFFGAPIRKIDVSTIIKITMARSFRHLAFDPVIVTDSQYIRLRFLAGMWPSGKPAADLWTFLDASNASSTASSP